MSSSNFTGQPLPVTSLPSATKVDSTDSVMIIQSGQALLAEAGQFPSATIGSGPAGWLFRDGLGVISSEAFSSSADINVLNSTGVDGSPQWKLTQTGVVAGTYGGTALPPIITVDANGRITSVSNAGSPGLVAWSAITGTPTTLAGYGITDALSTAKGSQVGYFGSVGLHDTKGGEYLSLLSGENLSADKSLTLVVGNADRTLTMAGNATISGTNSGDQTITLTGDVTGSGTGSFATTLKSNISLSGVTTFPAGTAGSPSITFTGDSDTGFYSPGANQVAATTGGTQRLAISSTAITASLPMTLTSTLNVSGISTLGSQLQAVAGSASTPSIANAGDLGTGLFWPTAGALSVTAGGAEQMRIAALTPNSINYWYIAGAAAGSAPAQAVTGGDNTINILYYTRGAGGYVFYTNSASPVQQFAILHAAGAVNYLTVIGAATGSGPALSAVGGDLNITLNLRGKGTGNGCGVSVEAAGGRVGFFGSTPAVKPTVTGSRGGNAALASLLSALAGLGILTDSTTA